MTSKIKVRVGLLEIEYEGDNPIPTDVIKDIASHLRGLNGTHLHDTQETSDHGLAGSQPKPRLATTALHTNTIASKLGSKGAAELAIAAAAHLQLSEGKASFSRQELLDDMKSANNFYTKFMASNLSGTLKSLVNSQRINQISENSYSMSASELTIVESKLAKP